MRLLLNRCLFVISIGLSAGFAVVATASTSESHSGRTSVNGLMAAEAISSLSSGIRYRFGGTDPDHGLDCSAFIAHLFREAIGGNLPRTAKEISDVGQHVDLENMEPGDLVFFGNGKRGISHVGVYIGGKKFIHASPKHGVIYESGLNEPYWRHRFNGVRRLSVEQPQT